jgi:hypothetical protein
VQSDGVWLVCVLWGVEVWRIGVALPSLILHRHAGNVRVKCRMHLCTGNVWTWSRTCQGTDSPAWQSNNPLGCTVLSCDIVSHGLETPAHMPRAAEVLYDAGGCLKLTRLRHFYSIK